MTLAGGAVVVLGSGVVAAAVSGVMTQRWERQRTLLERRLSAAADFAGAAARASNALDGLARKIRPTALPGGDEIELLHGMCDQVLATIAQATEKAGLVRVLYGPAARISGCATEWGNRSNASALAAQSFLWVVAPIVAGEKRDPSRVSALREEMESELGLAREALNEFELASSESWSAP